MKRSKGNSDYITLVKIMVKQFKRNIDYLTNVRVMEKIL